MANTNQLETILMNITVDQIIINDLITSLTAAIEFMRVNAAQNVSSAIYNAEQSVRWARQAVPVEMSALIERERMIA